MIPVGLARTRPSYEHLTPPWGPGCDYPELAALAGSEPDGATNGVYAGVRSALHALGLDATHFGSAAWNPLGELVRRGGRVALKPNFIRHWNPHPEGSLESLITHGAVLRAVADYAFLAVGPEGSVVIAEAPQQDCDFDAIRSAVGLESLAERYRATGLSFEVIDLRREAVTFRDGVIVSRHSLPGDPAGYRVVDLGAKSFFEKADLDPSNFRGADYDPSDTSWHHSEGRHQYLLAETVLQADLVVNLPKLKTHKKTGVTLALKNLVGINGDKNWLPHHTLGSAAEGGDEYPEASALDRWRSRATELARPWLQRGRALPLFRLARRLEIATRGRDFVRSGNWWGNRTTWRMCLDLNLGFYYSDPKEEGLHLEAPAPVRRTLTLLDGIVGGEDEGPLSTRDVPLGVVLAATDPVALDLVAVRLMGFDENRIPKVREALAARAPRLFSASGPGDVRVREIHVGADAVRERTLDEIHCEHAFTPHPGWLGHVERSSL